jgi:hypothetical protein
LEAKILSVQLALTRRAFALLRINVRRLANSPQVSEAMFAASSRQGRSIKIFLFGLGVILPLGSLIWALLLLHGSTVSQSAHLPKVSR